MQPQLRITLTGDLTIGLDGQLVVNNAFGPLGSVVFAFLVLERHRLVGFDELADALWGENLPATWRPALRGIASRVRGILRTAELSSLIDLVSASGCYRLTLPPVTEVDLDVAISDGKAAREAWAAGESSEAIRLARSSITAARTNFLPGTRGHWVEAREHELRSSRMGTLEVLAEAAYETGDYVTSYFAAKEVAAEEPLRESGYLMLIKSLGAEGKLTEALSVYKACSALFDEELQVQPSLALRRVEQGLREELEEGPDHERLPGIPAPSFPVPISAFVGRHDELADLEARLDEGHRLVTLTGSAGVGKTRLACEVARARLAKFPDGAWLVELADMRYSTVATQVAAALSIRVSPDADPTELITERLVHRRALIVLDNCDHAVDECAELADRLLRFAPGVTIVATSRESLHVAGELIWTVPPLSCPGPGLPRDGRAAHDCDAVRLFLDRAHLTDRMAELDLEAVVEICERLDGLPLAIELAASRARVFGPRELARLIDTTVLSYPQSPADGVSARHRSLAAALDSSYERLSRSERWLFLSLAAFSSSFTLEAVEAVAELGERDVAEGLYVLVDKSMVVAERHDAVTRFRLLQTIRDYARGKLSEAGERTRVAARYVRWASGVAGQPQLVGETPRSHSDVSFQLLDVELQNLRGALQWALSEGDAEGLRLALALSGFWEVRGYSAEGVAWLKALVGVNGGDVLLQAKALNAAGILARDQFGNPAAQAEAKDLHTQARRLGVALGNQGVITSAVHGLANVAVATGEYVRAQSLFEENLSVARRSGDKRVIAACLVNLASTALQRGEHDAISDHEGGMVRANLREAIAIQREVGDYRGLALSLENLGVLYAMDGDLRLGAGSLGDARRIYALVGDKRGVAAASRFLGEIAYLEGDLALAQPLLEDALKIEEDLGVSRRIENTRKILATITERRQLVGGSR